MLQISVHRKNGGVDYSYDDNGNLVEKKTSDSVTTYTYDIENRLTAVREGGALLMAASYDGDGNRVFQVTRQMSDAAQWNVSEDEGKGAGRYGDSDTPNDKFPGSSIIHSFYEKIFGDPENTIFWYGFGQGMLQSTSVANASLAAVLSDWFCNFWNMVTGEYDLVLRSEVDYSDEDIDFMEYAGLSDKDIEDITSTQIVIPENSDEAKQIDYELTYYVNDINTANTQVLMTYGRNDTEKDVYTYGLDRIVHDDLQSDIASDYIYDGRGSVVQTVVDGEIDLSITYDPYGDITGGVDENFIGYAYNGEESNEVTGLQYLRARYYNTEIGSFISIDSYLGSITEPISQNRYTYANNNPVNNIDPTGHYSQGVNKYYQSTGLNELRDQMVAASFHAGEVEAQNAFNRQVARAQNTSMFKYNRISGISQDTANAYIANGIIKAAETSMNYGCDTPTLSAEAVATYVVTVQNAKTTANQKISNIKRNKQAQYRAYMEYQRELQRQREAAAEQERIRRNLQKMMAVVSSGLAGVTKTLETLNGVRTSNGGPVETSPFDMFWDTVGGLSNLPGDLWDAGGQVLDAVTDMPGEIWAAVTSQFTVDGDRAYICKIGTEDNEGIVQSDASFYVGNIKTKNDAKIQWFNNKLGIKPNVNLDAGISASILSGDLNATSKIIADINITSLSNIDFFATDLNGKTVLGYDKYGFPQFYIEGNAIASVVDGNTVYTLDLAGMEINLILNGHAGSFGGTGKFGYYEEDGLRNIKWGLSGALLVGGGYEVNIKW